MFVFGFIRYCNILFIFSAPPSPASSGVVSEQDYHSRSSGTSSPPLPPPPPQEAEAVSLVPQNYLEKGLNYYMTFFFVQVVWNFKGNGNEYD